MNIFVGETSNATSIFAILQVNQKIYITMIIKNIKEYLTVKVNFIPSTELKKINICYVLLYQTWKYFAKNNFIEIFFNLRYDMSQFF